MILAKGNCKFIKHDQQGVFEQENGEKCRYKLKDLLFENFKRKGKSKSGAKDEEIEEFLKACKDENIFSTNISNQAVDELKSSNMELMKKFDECSKELGSFHGEKNLDHGKVAKFGDYSFLFPPQCISYHSMTNGNGKHGIINLSTTLKIN